MAENNRDQNQSSDRSTQQDQNSNQENQTQNTSNQQQQDQNPQQGTKWSNYRTREMSDEGYSKENTSEKSGE